MNSLFLDDADSVNTVPSCASVQNDVVDPDDMPLKHLVHNGKQLTNILYNIWRCTLYF